MPRLILAPDLEHDRFSTIALLGSAIRGKEIFVATIVLDPDNMLSGTWWLTWTERGEVIGRVLQDPDGRCRIAPQGPHWGPMKSFAGQSFDDREAALAEVSRYFGRR